MKLFFVIYAVIVLSVAALTFFLSYNSEKAPAYNTALTVTYILALLGLIAAMSVMEGRFKIPMLHSSVIALLSLAVIYAADSSGSKINKKDDKD